MIALWSLLACAPRWTEAAALAPHLARLDADGDGRVRAGEYDPHVWNGPSFGSADRDHDGVLSAAELSALVRAQQPTSFDGISAEAELRRGSVVAAPTGGGRDAWEVLVWLNDELRHAGDPGLDPDAVAVAVARGRLDSAEGLALLAVLRPRWEAKGWAGPEALP